MKAQLAVAGLDQLQVLEVEDRYLEVVVGSRAVRLVSISAAMSTESALQDGRELLDAVARRRNFAIISHPDAGKTTLTEKLLLYGGAIQQAGAVKPRRTTQSDV